MDCRDNRQYRIRHQQVAPFYSGAMARIYSGVDNPTPAEKKAPQKRPRKAWRSMTSFFKRGIRRLQAIFQSFAPLPTLWAVWRN